LVFLKGGGGEPQNLLFQKKKRTKGWGGWFGKKQKSFFLGKKRRKIKKTNNKRKGGKGRKGKKEFGFRATPTKVKVRCSKRGASPKPKKHVKPLFFGEKEGGNLCPNTP